jgi:hypothetical protein
LQAQKTVERADDDLVLCTYLMEEDGPERGYAPETNVISSINEL